MFPPDDQLVEFFLEAYRHGAFPMAEPERPRRRRGGAAPGPASITARKIDWYIPDPRAVIDLTAAPHAAGDLGGFHVPRSLAKRLRSARFEVTTDEAFEPVIRACAEPAPGRGRDDSWLDERLIHAYVMLHRAGHAHSVEAWASSGPGTGRSLVGGVYGVALGGLFAAESMFCRPELGGTDASKVALARLVHHLRARGFSLLDVQIRNQHTDRFGVIDIPHAEYAQRVQKLAKQRLSWCEPGQGLTPWVRPESGH